MKPIISLMVVIATTGITAKCLGEAAVYLNNYDLNRPLYYRDGVNKVLAPIGTRILIEGGASGAALTPIGAEFGLTEPGFFDNGFGTIAGAADNANVDLRLTARYQFCIINDVTWSQKAGANPGASTQPTPAMLDLPGIMVIPLEGSALCLPEPSTTVTLLGGGVLLWLFRRNRPRDSLLLYGRNGTRRERIPRPARA